MSNEKAIKKTEEIVKPAVSTAKTIKKETEFPLYELREHSLELFGVKSEVIDGAFLNYKNVKATKKQAENLIKSFLKKEVK
ncbi:hypothetical protein [Gracilibacillus orientalis]|uniref:hypothetical protein n=1 Tax=Gracilibacillus orientalis TaxID=334253 RepID=UPI0011141F87|nr:hypothetical protein [Gracilibacillus orientalis]